MMSGEGRRHYYIIIVPEGYKRILIKGQILLDRLY